MTNPVARAVAALLVALGLTGAGGEAVVYRLGAGDRLRVTVFEEPDLSGEFEVDGGGTVALPLVGQVPLAGLAIGEAEGAVAARLRDGYLRRPRVSIDVLNYRPFYILGEVKAPGRYPFEAGLTVLRAAALAGGFTYRADEGDITVVRGGTAVASSVPPDSGETAPIAIDDPVLPGDVIRVGERFF